MIPKVIYQTYHTKNIPNRVKKIFDDMIDLNTGYEYFLFDDNEIELFIKENMDERVFNAFKMLEVGASKADLWRYCILYKNGGIYLDIDSVIFKSLDTLISEDSSAIISRESHKDIFLQWCLIFEANHPILEICIQKCVDNILNKKSNNVLYLTGPVVFSSSVFEYCKSLDENIWTTPDDIINKKLNDNNLKLSIYSTDFRDFCRYKHEFYLDIENTNLFHNGKRHWSEEKIIFKNEG